MITMEQNKPTNIINKTIEFTYTNWKGNIDKRKAKVVSLFWGSTHYHPENQWLLFCYDLEKQDYRYFALVAINNLEIVNE